MLHRRYRLGLGLSLLLLLAVPPAAAQPPGAGEPEEDDRQEPGEAPPDTDPSPVEDGRAESEGAEDEGGESDEPEDSTEGTESAAADDGAGEVVEGGGSDQATGDAQTDDVEEDDVEEDDVEENEGNDVEGNDVEEEEYEYPDGEGTDLGVDAIEDLDLEALLAEPVVTASGGAAEERVMASANVTVVSREEIARHGWLSIAEVLANQPGLYVVDDLVVPSVSVRGVSGGLRGGARIIRVMINGVPVNFRPDLSAFLGMEFVPIEAVERIEIAQGPLSALYGANAFLATVNVITRRPAEGNTETEVAARGALIRESVGGGGFSISTVHGDEDFGLLLALSVHHLDRSGLTIRQTYPSQDPSLERYASILDATSENDLSTPQSGLFRLHIGRPTSDWGRLILQGGLQRLDSSPEFQVNTAMSHRSRVTIDNFWIGLRHTKRWSDELSHTIDFGFSTGRPNRDSVLVLPERFNASWYPNFGYNAFNFGANVSWNPLGRQLGFRLGLDGEIDLEDTLRYTQTFLVPVGDRPAGSSLELSAPGIPTSQTISDVGVALQVSSTPMPEDLPGLRLTGDVRLDFINYGNEEVPLQYSWRAGVVYRWSEELTTKIVGGEAFQLPSPVLTFAQGGFGISNNVLGTANLAGVGIPSLTPQRVAGGEAIASLHLFDALTADVGLFVQHVQDRIVFRLLATDFVAINDEPLTSTGALANVRVRADRFSAYATFTGQLQILDNGLSGVPTAQYPNVFGTVGANLDVPEAFFRVNAHLRWAGERGSTQSNTLLNDSTPYSLAPYATLDLTVNSMGLHPWQESETRVSFSVRNLFDTRYFEPGFAGFDIPVMGRTFWLEVRQTF